MLNTFTVIKKSILGTIVLAHLEKRTSTLSTQLSYLQGNLHVHVNKQLIGHSMQVMQIT